MTIRPDLLLIHPAGRSAVYQQLGDRLAAIEPPVWAGLMASFARAQGLAVELLDAEALELAPDQLAAAVDELNPILTAVVVYGHQPSASTQMMPAARKTCQAIRWRRPDLPLALAGGHVAALPKRTLAEEPVDFVCGGEGLWTLVELARALQSGSELARVRGLWRRCSSEIVAGPPAPLLQDLDGQMPGPAWDLLPMDRYRAHNWHCLDGSPRQPYAALYTTLGCPYHCAFCCIQAPFREGERALQIKQGANSYRFWRPDAVLSQLELLAARYGVRNLKIADEMFVLTPRHVNAICDGIIERGLDLNIWAYARVDTVRDEMLDRLKRAGFNWLALGIEAANPRVRQDVQKGFDQSRIRATIRRIQDAGISVIGNFIFGLPEDDEASMQETLALALELRCEFANFYCAMAYPGSQLYSRALAEGWPLPQEWSGYSQHSVDTLPMPTRALTGPEVVRFRDSAFQTYYMDPKYLAGIRSKFGERSLDEIRRMSAIRLERRAA